MPELRAEPRQRDPPVRLRRLTRGEALTLALWAAAALIYISVGVFFIDFMLSVFVCAGYLLVVIWLAPTVVRRLLERGAR
jgi:hypothetical protein